MSDTSPAITGNAMKHDFVIEFKDYLLYELNRSSHTSEAYCTDVAEFFRWLNPTKETCDPGSVTTADIRTWLGSIATTRSATTLRRKAQSLRAFYQWMMRKRKCDVNPAADVRLAKAPKRLPEFVKESEIEEVIKETEAAESCGNACSAEAFRAERAHMIVLILYSTGIRREELQGIRDSDINPYSSEMKVTGKRSKQRVIPVAPELLEEIEQWKQIRDAHYPSLPADPPLFSNRRGEPLSLATINNIVRDTLDATTSSKKSPHVLRHTFATLMLNGGSDLNSVKEFLGHASLSTTQIYTHLSYAELKKNYDGAHPRGTNGGR